MPWKTVSAALALVLTLAVVASAAAATFTVKAVDRAGNTTSEASNAAADVC